MDKGWAPGNVFGVDICRLVLGGDVNSVRSFGSLINPPAPGEVITQLLSCVSLASLECRENEWSSWWN